MIGAIALFAARSHQRLLAGLGALAALTTAGIAGYHTGVERKWWEGPTSCTGTGGGLGDLSATELVPGASDAPLLVLCDSFTPFLFGLSMANWNMIAALGLVVIWIAAFRRAS